MEQTSNCINHHIPPFHKQKSLQFVWKFDQNRYKMITYLTRPLGFLKFPQIVSVLSVCFSFFFNFCCCILNCHYVIQMHNKQTDSWNGFTYFVTVCPR